MTARGRVLTTNDTRQIALGSIAEEALLSHTLRLIKLSGACALHIRYSQGVLQGAHGPRSSDHDDASGFPDLVIVHPDRGVLWRELKREKGRMDANQRRWGELLTAAGQNWDVWRPSDERRILAELGLHQS